MTSNDERGRAAEPAGEVGESAPAQRRRLRTRVVSEALVAAVPAEGETTPAAPAERPRRPRTRVVSEALVAAFSEGEGPELGGGADDEAGAGA